MKFDCEFLFAALAEKQNAVIRKIREIPPWEVPDGLYKPIAPNPWTLPVFPAVDFTNPLKTLGETHFDR